MLARLGTTPAGLSAAEVRRRLARYGPNKIAARRRVGVAAMLVHQFASPVAALLAAAMALSVVFGEIREAAAIAVVLALNAVIGFVTELKATRSIEALRALDSRSARVRRDGHVAVVAASDLVPGDIVILDAGDAVAADLRLIEASNMAADESALTGELVAVDKDVTPVADGAALGDRASMLYKGTSVTRGSGTGVAVATGLATELGRISELVDEADPGSSPLEKKLARLSGQLIWATLAICALVALLGLARGQDGFLAVEAAIALAVAAIPEGLPIVATMALARGMWRMARHNVLIERLAAVETLGATTVILTDKTGTLTENRMTVRRLRIASGEIDLAAAGGAPEAASGVAAGVDAADPGLGALLDVAVLCNDATLEGADDAGSGDPMELALLRAGLASGRRRPDLLAARPQLGKQAFDNHTRMMATVHAEGDAGVDAGTGGVCIAIKGAPEAVLAVSTRVLRDGAAAPLDAAGRADWAGRVEDLGRQGLRVLALATKSAPDAAAEPYGELTLLGLIGLEDPARADAAPAIRACRRAGIRVVMVTGDHAVTARSIARAVGLGGDDARVATGPEIAALVEAGGLAEVAVFARVTPAEKLDLVRACQARGDIVAMTGDGVNDAPALRQADIGVAMGQRGTDVARQAAAMILLDDAFASIVGAVREGRVIFGNIRRFSAYLLACNMTEVLVVGLAVLSGLPLPVLPLQILYLNLVTDIFPAFALAMGEGEDDVLDRPPRPPSEPILARAQWRALGLQSLAMTAGVFGALAAARLWLGLDAGETVTVSFLTLAFAQLWHVVNLRRPTSRLIRNEITRNPWVWAALGLCAALLVVPVYLPPLARVLSLSSLDARMWAVVLGFSLAPVAVIQTAAQIGLRLRRRGRGQGQGRR